MLRLCRTISEYPLGKWRNIGCATSQKELFECGILIVELYQARAYLDDFDTLIPATEFMTREEVIATLKRACAAFDQKTLDAIAAQVHHEHTVRNLQPELDLKDERIAQVESDRSALERVVANKDAELTEKDVALAEKDSKIRELEKQLEDIRHSEATLKKEKFAGSPPIAHIKEQKMTASSDRS